MKIEKVPKSFQLAGVVWAVEETDAISDMGHCDGENAIIRIRKDLPKQMKLATFTHELMHAIKFAAGIPQEEHNEREIDAMGNLLHQFLITCKN